MLLYVSHGKTGPVVKTPGKTHTRPLMFSDLFSSNTHKKRDKYNKKQYLLHKSRTIVLILAAVK